MAESNIVFKRGTGSKIKDKKLLEVDEEISSMQNRRENALVINFKAPENEAMNIYQFFDDFDELEPIYINIADAGDVEYYFRGISPINEQIEGDKTEQQFNVTLQLRRESL